MSKEIILLQGGLGNQLFQYAFYLAKKKKGANVVCDTSLFFANSQHNGFELEHIFGILLSGKKTTSLLVCILCKMIMWNNNVLCKGILQILNYFRLFLIEDSIPSVFYSSLLYPQKKKGTYFYLGYWQTEKYFRDIRDEILQIFTFNEGMLSNKSKAILNEIERTNSVSLHVRRGDFLSSQNKSLYGGICTLEYYNKAIDFVLSKEKDVTFFVFSNEINWVKNNIYIPNAVFIDFNRKEDSWQDMFLMSKCQHNIIANSSFSWWGAWLNKNPQKKVISPSRFLNLHAKSDIIPLEWITI